MKRIWINYNEWEDFKHGFYSSKKHENEKELNELVSRMFSFQDVFYIGGIEMLKNWKQSCDYNLSNTTCNRKSYIGQAVACYLYGASSKFTANVFLSMSEKDRNESNETAKRIISYYEENYYDENHPNIVRGKNEKLS